MEEIHVYLVGVGLFAESVEKMIRESGAVGRVECFPTIGMTIQSIEQQPPDVIILADVDTTILVGNTPFWSIGSGIPVICADHQSPRMKLITSTNIDARLTDLVSVLTILKRTKAKR